MNDKLIRDDFKALEDMLHDFTCRVYYGCSKKQWEDFMSEEKRVKSLELNVADHEQSIGGLQEKVGTLEDKVRDHEREIAFIQKALDDDTLLSNPGDGVVNLKEYARVAKENERLRDDLRNANEFIFRTGMEAGENAKRTAKEFEKLKAENLSLANDVDKFRNRAEENTKLRARVDELVKDNNREMEFNRRQQMDHDRERSGLRDKIRNLEAEVAGCHKDRGCSTKTCGMLNDAIGQITCMESKIDAERETNAALVSKNQDLANRINMKDDGDKVKELKRDVGALREHISSLKQSVEEYRNKYETQQKFNDELRDTIKSKDREIRETCVERNTYRFANIDLSQAVTTLKAKLYVREEDKKNA